MAKVLKRPKPRGRHRLWEHDAALCQEHGNLVGVDEAGRGAFAGPVVAAAVYLPKGFFEELSFKQATRPIFDSKQVSPEERDALFDKITTWQGVGHLRFAAAQGSVKEVESHNVVGATVLAMTRALEGLNLPLESRGASPLPLFDRPSTDPLPHVLVDGRPLKTLRYAHCGLVQGDAKSLAIAMASIVAKVTRDRMMVALDADFPAYGFASHKGYGTPAHQAAIAEHGVTVHHRATFLKNTLTTPSLSNATESQAILSLPRC